MSERERTKVHVIPHTHWDREWYFTTSRSKVYLVKHVKEVLNALETIEGFHYYLLDAQGSLLDDYIRWCPEDEERIRNLVSAKRLMTGPWYTQTDQLVISSESMVRNLYYGTETARKYGHSMKVGYVPDAFGQSAQMPQIYREFGIERFLFWRGVSDNTNPRTEFTWEGSDGSQVFAVQMPFGYYYGGNIPEDAEDLQPYLEKQIGALENKASTRHVYFPNGFDQAPIRLNLPQLIERFNQIDDKREYVMNEPERFMAEIEADSHDLPVLRGELMEAKHMRIHKSIFSTRADLKQQNNQIENFIANILEPVLAISHSLGHEYPHRIVEDIWKLMFENAAHDSIGGCNSDTTNQDVAFRYKQANDIARNLLDLHMRMIASTIEQEETFAFTLFNTLPYVRGGVTEIEAYIPEESFVIRDTKGRELAYAIVEKVDQTDYVLGQHIDLNPSRKVYLPDRVYRAKLLVELQEVPAMGYTQIIFDFSQGTAPTIERRNEQHIENEFFAIVVEDNGTLTITDKTSGQTYANQMVFEDNGDDGDSYNYSPPERDLIVSSIGSKLNVTTAKTTVLEELQLGCTLNVPADLHEREAGISSGQLPIQVQVGLRKGERLIRFEVQVQNQVLSHRLRVLFDTGLASSLSIADQPFGVIARPTSLPEVEVWEREKWQEKPITIEAMQSYAGLNDGNRGIVVITEGVREYEIVGEKMDTIALTLFRTFGFMGKENLVYRPGRASGEKIVATPDAQLLGELSFSFALYIHNAGLDEARVAHVAREYLTPIASYQLCDFLNGRLIFAFRDEERTLPQNYSLMSFNEESNAVLSAFKKAEHSDGYIIRVFNPYLKQNAQATVQFNQSVSVERVSLAEQSLEPAQVIADKEQVISLPELTHCKLMTILVSKAD
ncbi:mannosylglycerate hydrolase [Paenibacillus sp. MER 99-2]|uniref:mannosylglycerate hydrolase n=1 Tax=Paenibacillus sp. MER 99-2 TaxID=2939572 RepID=UPI00204042F2|nr:mannosylglycerate hydrolase [Paenibacillus sp. MER 99-2]MCM3173056.1 mannosylglycerate hydrolase [Paenibacillus sp. MER 99-2]